MISIANSPVPHLQTVSEFDEFVEKYYIPAEPKVVVEIGSFYGATLWAWIVNNPKLETLIAIDLPITPEDSRYQGMVEARKQWINWSSVNLIDYEGDSHSNKTMFDIYKIVKPSTVDMLFIDGDHSYEGVKEDWQRYHSLVKDGGLVVFHDSIGYDSVNRLCTELNREGYEGKHINHPGGWGLFVVQL